MFPISRLGGVVGFPLAFSTQGCGFEPVPSRWTFMMQNRKWPCRMIKRHVKDPYSIYLACVLSAKLNSSTDSHCQRSGASSREETERQNYLW
ncbi:hypothetical protein TNCV_717161 [Trichonephila clavipes]|nr:hypothetical protein TNCV_717161 [Trichonephila clavipes]